MSHSKAPPAALRIASLDGIRAFSVVLVFLAHAGLDAFVPGGLGVTIFFFLSGYLITSLLRVEYERNGTISLRHFWLRRLLRIQPPFYVVLLAASLLTWAVQTPVDIAVGPIVAQAFQFSNYWIIRHGYGSLILGSSVYWSLAVEEHFYLVFPWIFIGMQRARLSGRAQAAVLAGLCGAVLAWRCYLVLSMNAAGDRTYMGSDTRIDSILFGCVLATWRNPALDAPLIAERWWKFVLVPVATLVLAACLAVRGEVFRETVRYSLQGLALAFLFVAAVRFKDWAVFRPLNWRPVEFLGVLSYAIYLVHFSVIQALQRLLPAVGPVPQAILAFALSVLLAWGIYRSIERPCARLRKRLTD